MKKRIEENQLAGGNVTKLFLRYLFPSVGATLLIAGNYLIDTICVGMKIGETGLAALNVVVPLDRPTFSPIAWGREIQSLQSGTMERR